MWWRIDGISSVYILIIRTDGRCDAMWYVQSLDHDHSKEKIYEAWLLKFKVKISSKQLSAYFAWKNVAIEAKPINAVEKTKDDQRSKKIAYVATLVVVVGLLVLVFGCCNFTRTLSNSP